MAKREYIQANKDWLEAKAKEDGKEIHRASQFIDLEELKYNINRYIELLAQ